MTQGEKTAATRQQAQEMQDAVTMGMPRALTRDEVIADMYRDGKRILDIEVEMQVSPQTIYRALARQGIVLRRGRNKPTVWDYAAALELVVGDEVAKQIQEKIGWKP